MQRFKYADPTVPRNFTIDSKILFSDLERLDDIRTMLANDYSTSEDPEFSIRRDLHIQRRQDIRNALLFVVEGMKYL